LRTIWWTSNTIVELGRYKAENHDDERQVVEVDGDVEASQYFVASVHALVVAGSR